MRIVNLNKKKDWKKLILKRVLRMKSGFYYLVKKLVTRYKVL